MKKYSRAVICVIYSLIKFCLIKMFHFRRFNFSLINVVSPFTEISVDKEAKLTLGKPARMRSGAKIRVRKGAEVSIGDNTYINHGCMIVSHEKIIIGKDVQFSPNVLVYDHDHDFRVGLKNQQYKCTPIVIGDNVWIGANTVILRGTKIGNNSVIGAGCVIKGEYPDNMLILQKRETTECSIVGDR